MIEYSLCIGEILWQHWVDAFKWSVDGRHFRIHPQLTKQHIDPQNLDKMKNHLAEQVLDHHMLYFMKVSEALGKYQIHLHVCIILFSRIKYKLGFHETEMLLHS